jgi:hypothetical protein
MVLRPRQHPKALATRGFRQPPIERTNGTDETSDSARSNATPSWAASAARGEYGPSRGKALDRDGVVLQGLASDWTWTSSCVQAIFAFASSPYARSSSRLRAGREISKDVSLRFSSRATSRGGDCIDRIGCRGGRTLFVDVIQSSDVAAEPGSIQMSRASTSITIPAAGLHGVIIDSSLLSEPPFRWKYHASHLLIAIANHFDPFPAPLVDACGLQQRRFR